MLVVIIVVDVIVVVLPVLISRVVRGVYVDRVDLALVRVQQSLKRVEVLGIDNYVRRLVPTSLDVTSANKTG